MTTAPRLEELAARVEALSAEVGDILDEANYVVCVSGYHPDDRERVRAVYKKLNNRADLLYRMESVITALRARAAMEATDA